MQRIFISLVAAMVFVTIAACGGSSKSSTATPSSARTPVAVRTTARPATTPSVPPGATGSVTALATSAAPGETVELTGIVGTIAGSARVIQVTRLSGANVNQVAVQDSTRIRTAEGVSAT